MSTDDKTEVEAEIEAAEQARSAEVVQFETDEEREAKIRAERAEYLAGLDNDEVLEEGTDAELYAETVRCQKAMERCHTRGLPLGHQRAVERLEAGFERLPAYRAQAEDRLRHEITTRHDGPLPETLAAYLIAITAEKNAESLATSAQPLTAPNGSSIVEGDPVREMREQRNALDHRRALIGNELELREATRRADRLAADMKGKR